MLLECAHHLILDCVHPAPIRSGLVIETVQVQKAVHQVQLDLTPGCRAKFCGEPLRGLRADKNFAVLKGYHISRTCDFLETQMQTGNSSVRNQEDIDARQAGQHALPFGKRQATIDRAPREILESGEIDVHRALQITNRDDRNRFQDELTFSFSRFFTSSACSDAYNFSSRSIEVPAAAARRSGSPQIASSSRRLPFSKSINVDGL